MMYEPIKPRPIEAMQLTWENQEEVKAWCGGNSWTMAPLRQIAGVEILTGADVVHARFGDYIIKLRSHSFVSIPMEDFERLYRPVSNTQPPQENES